MVKPTMPEWEAHCKAQALNKWDHAKNLADMIRRREAWISQYEYQQDLKYVGRTIYRLCRVLHDTPFKGKPEHLTEVKR